MKAKSGDRLVIKSHKIGDPMRYAEILEVQGKNSEPPYLVRWSDGHESVVYPGPDAVIETRNANRSLASQ